MNKYSLMLFCISIATSYLNVACVYRSRTHNGLGQCCVLYRQSLSLFNG